MYKNENKFQYFAKRLKELRNERNLSLAKAAEKITISISTLLNLEKGTRIPTSTVLDKLTNFYNVSIENLLDKDICYLDIYRPNHKNRSKNKLHTQSKDFKMSYLAKIIGTNLNVIREIKSMTSKYVATLIGEEASNYLQYENGKRIPSMKTLILLSRILNCEVQDFFDEDIILNKKSTARITFKFTQSELCKYFIHKWNQMCCEVIRNTAAYSSEALIVKIYDPSKCHMDKKFWKCIGSIEFKNKLLFLMNSEKIFNELKHEQYSDLRGIIKRMYLV